MNSVNSATYRNNINNTQISNNSRSNHKLIGGNQGTDTEGEVSNIADLSKTIKSVKNIQKPPSQNYLFSKNKK